MSGFKPERQTANYFSKLRRLITKLQI